jgi:hypothetical protein
MKVLGFCTSLLLIFYSAGFELLLVMSYSNYEDFISKKERLLGSQSTPERILAKSLYWSAEHRLLLCAIGVVGLMTSLLMN